MDYNISMIAGMDKNGVIGRGNSMPWKCSADMRFFVDKTQGKTVVMGRKTWDSLPKKPLPGRRNVVITRGDTSSLEKEGATCLTVDQALLLSTEEECVVIGGSEMYSLFLPYAKHVYLNELDAVVKRGDAFFPLSEMEKSHRCLSTVAGKAVIEIPSGGISDTVDIHYYHYIPK